MNNISDDIGDGLHIEAIFMLERKKSVDKQGDQQGIV